MAESNDEISLHVDAKELDQFPETIDRKKRKRENDADKVHFNVYVNKSHPKARIPRKGSKQAAGYDLYTCEDGVIRAGEVCLVNTGIQIEIQSRNMCAKIYSRSGLKTNLRIGIVDSPSIIDRDFTETIYLPMYNYGTRDFKYTEGQRIAQMVFEKYSNVEWVCVDNKTKFPKYGKADKQRGSFGSTGYY